MNQGDLFEPRYPVGIPPAVCLMFEKFALEVAANGRARYSSKSVVERLRWHYDFEKQDPAFKLNNNWTAQLARWFLARHPELPSFFETREREIDGYREAAE